MYLMKRFVFAIYFLAKKLGYSDPKPVVLVLLYFVCTLLCLAIYSPLYYYFDWPGYVIVSVLIVSSLVESVYKKGIDRILDKELHTFKKYETPAFYNTAIVSGSYLLCIIIVILVAALSNYFL